MKASLTFACLLLSALPLGAQAEQRLPLQVVETGGMRRTQFPVKAELSFPRGEFTDAMHARLLLNDAEVPAQVTVRTRWNDGSAEYLDVDFNTSPGPLEKLDYRLVYGPGVQAPAVPRGLTLTEDADAIQVGNVRFSKSGVPLLASVKYRDEVIGAGVNGLVLTDRNGVSHDLSTAHDLKTEIVKRGPLVAELAYRGTFAIGSQSLPFRLDVEMPSSKSWVKLTAWVSGDQIRDVALHLPLALGPAPWLWDFGTSQWTYGVLRTPTDAVVLDHRLKPRAPSEWSVTTTSNGRPQVYETSTSDHATFEGWGHLQGGKDAVAFAVPQTASGRDSSYNISLGGSGQMTLRVSASNTGGPALTVYEHFVGTPVQVGAATSPASILSPVLVTCDEAHRVGSRASQPR